MGIFIFRFYFLIKNYKQGKFIKIYGQFAYWGLGIAVLGVILLMEPIFTKLPVNLSGIVPWAIAMSIFTVAGHLLLKPTFLKNKY